MGQIAGKEVTTMPEAIIPQASGGALSAEHYQTFEMAKEHDSVLGGDNIAELLAYSAGTRAQAQAIHAALAATKSIDDATTLRADAIENMQAFAKVSIYGDTRIGELLKELPKNNKWSDSPMGKTDAIKKAGISTKTAYDLEKLAANQDLVELVIANAETAGTIPSRSQVLNAIRERENAIRDRDMNQRIAEKLKAERDDARAEIEALERQNDQLYEQAQQAKEPRVVTREVVPDDYQSAKHERDVYLSDVQKLRKRNEELRKELDRAKDMLGIDKTLQDVRKDVQYLTTATNNYVRQYGGLTWTAASFEQVDAQAIDALRTAAINLATFANALVASLENNNG